MKVQHKISVIPPLITLGPLVFSTLLLLAVVVSLSKAKSKDVENSTRSGQTSGFSCNHYDTHH